MNETTEPKKRFGFVSRFKVRIKKFYSRFDVKKAHFDSLELNQKKAIEIVKVCIKNKNSHLYCHPKTGFAQIELPEIFITITQTKGYYEVDLVYVNQTLPTSDKILFDSSSIIHINDMFDKEIVERMINNASRRDMVITSHLNNLLKETEKLH